MIRVLVIDTVLMIRVLNIDTVLMISVRYRHCSHD